ncbi:MAG: AbrB/MazE/SpoVT family DNA-binding domain-containing protein [Bryobacteraceae bacterium]
MSTLTATVEKSGRILIPASIRKQLKIGAGSEVILRVDKTGLRIETREQALDRIQQELRKYIPEGRMLSEELLLERRQEATRENAASATISKRR